MIYDRFADDALYSIHLTHPETGRTIPPYDFQFSSVTAGYKNLDTILSYGLGTEAGFFADTPGIFDRLDSRILGSDGAGQTGNGVDGFKRYNVLAYAISPCSVPISCLLPASFLRHALGPCRRS